jgi:PAS domain S-box-containing protein
MKPSEINPSPQVNAFGEGILFIQQDGCITMLNHPILQITGLSSGDIIGKRLTELHLPALGELGFTAQEAQEFNHALHMGEGLAKSKYYYKSQGVHFERITAFIHGENNKPSGCVLVIRDLTEEINTMLAREKIFDTLVHDMRSPLSTVKTTLEIIQAAMTELDEDTQQLLAIAQRSAHRAITLIQFLSTISKLDSGTIELNKQMLDIQQLVSNTIAEMTLEANEVGISLWGNYPTELPKVYADTDLIHRVLVNLVDNTIKFTPEGGQVEVTVVIHHEEEVAVHVSDTGPGIPEKYQNRVFNRFFQVPGVKSRRRGSGLGLTFCRLAVEAHGGRIWNEPNQKGGTVFSFTLPLNNSGSSSPAGNKGVGS